MGTPIRIRCTLNDTPIDSIPPSTGEPFLHLGDNKFGIYNGSDMLWYPCLDPLSKTMLMNMNQKLSGYDSNGNSTVYISFDTPNAITFLDSIGTVLARFDATGASFNNLSAINPVGGGSLNRLIHPGFIPGIFPSTGQTVNTAATKKWVGPNTLMFIMTGGSGNFTCTQSYIAGSGGLTHTVAEMLTLNVTVTTNLVSGGLRMYVLEPNTGYFSNTAKNKNRFFISVKGPLGKTSYLRVGRNGSYDYKQIIGTGNWARYYIDLPQHSYLSDFIQGGTSAPYAIDVLYNAEAGVWGIAEPTLQCIDNISDEIYQYKSLAERMNAANMIWFEPVGYQMYGTSRNYINLPIQMPIYNDPYVTYTVETIESTFTPVVDQKSRKGFEVRTNVANSSYWKYQPRIIIHGQLTDIA